MAITDEPTRVLFIGASDATQQQIRAALSNNSEFELIDILTTTERLAREIFSAEPEIVLVDHSIESGETTQLDIIAEISQQFSEISSIAILPGEGISAVQKVLLAGARAFIIQPFSQINLLSTLRRIRELAARQKQIRQAVISGPTEMSSQPLRAIAVYSPRGGVGCSTIAANLALSIYEETNQRVLLMEGKLFFGHLDVFLNINTQNSIADLIAHANNLDENLIRDVITRHASGLHVLLAPNDIQVAQGIRADDLYNVFIGLQRMYDFIVIDTGSSLSENTVTLMDAADKILLVTSPELASLHDASRFIQFSRSLAYPAEKLLVTLNRTGLTGGLRPRDIENALHHELFAQIPEDGPSVLRSLNRGIPLTIRAPRNPVSRAIKSLANSLIRQNPVEAGRSSAGSAAGKPQRETVLASN
jgi:pilus assembly protein CpaE